MEEKSKLAAEGSLSLFRKNIENKTICLCLQGKSIETLEKRIEEFKGANVVWAGQNRYICIQKNILNKIKTKMKVVMDLGTVKHEEEYEQFVRYPRLEEVLRINPEISILSSKIVMDSLQKYIKNFRINSNNNFVYIDVENSNMFIPNSLTVFLLLLTQYGAKQIILFGLDGFGNPKAFADKKPTAELMSSDGYNTISDTNTYYKPDIVKRDRKIGFGNADFSYLFSDSPPFNAFFMDVYNKFCKDQDTTPIKIYNCNPESNFTLFEKIDYDRAIKICQYDS